MSEEGLPSEKTCLLQFGRDGVSVSGISDRSDRACLRELGSLGLYGYFGVRA